MPRARAKARPVENETRLVPYRPRSLNVDLTDTTTLHASIFQFRQVAGPLIYLEGLLAHEQLPRAGSRSKNSDLCIIGHSQGIVHSLAAGSKARKLVLLSAMFQDSLENMRVSGNDIVAMDLSMLKKRPSVYFPGLKDLGSSEPIPYPAYSRLVGESTIRGLDRKIGVGPVASTLTSNAVFDLQSIMTLNFPATIVGAMESTSIDFKTRFCFVDCGPHERSIARSIIEESAIEAKCVMATSSTGMPGDPVPEGGVDMNVPSPMANETEEDVDMNYKLSSYISKHRYGAVKSYILPAERLGRPLARAQKRALVKASWSSQRFGTREIISPFWRSQPSRLSSLGSANASCSSQQILERIRSRLVKRTQLTEITRDAAGIVNIAKLSQLHSAPASKNHSSLATCRARLFRAICRPRVLDPLSSRSPFAPLSEGNCNCSIASFPQSSARWSRNLRSISSGCGLPRNLLPRAALRYLASPTPAPLARSLSKCATLKDLSFRSCATTSTCSQGPLPSLTSTSSSSMGPLPSRTSTSSSSMPFQICSESRHILGHLRSRHVTRTHRQEASAASLVQVTSSAQRSIRRVPLHRILQKSQRAPQRAPRRAAIALLPPVRSVADFMPLAIRAVDNSEQHRLGSTQLGDISYLPNVERHMARRRQYQPPLHPVFSLSDPMVDLMRQMRSPLQ